jgi:hypothetical protein
MALPELGDDVVFLLVGQVVVLLQIWGSVLQIFEYFCRKKLGHHFEKNNHNLSKKNENCSKSNKIAITLPPPVRISEYCCRILFRISCVWTDKRSHMSAEPIVNETICSKRHCLYTYYDIGIHNKISPHKHTKTWGKKVY